MSLPLQTLSPGAVLGVIGGGQLGRYFVLAARQAGYNTWVLDPDPDAPAMQLAHHPLCAAYDDEAALKTLGEACDGVTIEFENVPAQSLRLLGGLTQLSPRVESVEIAQNRQLEKAMALKSGLTPVPHRTVSDKADCHVESDTICYPAILKSAELGYDGKGQVVCASQAELESAFVQLGEVPCVLEQRIDLALEVSVVLARGFDGSVALFPVAENQHVNGILHTSMVPAGISDEQRRCVCDQAIQLARDLDYVGVLAVEFFIDQAGHLFFNEMAPRPHNSGHYTLDATVHSQFDQQLRALCALPFGATRLLSPATMVNVLGDLWQHRPPPFDRLLAEDECHLHLYGKQQARPGRKMGHYTLLAEQAEAARTQAEQCFERLKDS